MRRWALVACLVVDAASPATLALWPQHIDEQLLLSHAADGSSVVEASRGGALGTFNRKLDTQTEVPLDPVLDSIEIAWVPAVDIHSSVFNRFLTNSLHFDTTNVEGIHLKAKLKGGTAWSEINETHHVRIEKNVREILQNTLPTTGVVDNLSKGFLARSLCDFRAWKTNDPLQEILGEPTAEAPGLCYSSSFPFPSSKDGESLFTNAGQTDSVVVRALVEARQDFSSVQNELRLVVVRLGRGLASPASIEADCFEAWIATASDSKEPLNFGLSAGMSNDLLVVKSMDKGVDRNNLEYVWARRAGKPIESTSSSTLGIEGHTATAEASVQTSIAGEGFHRRFVMDVKVLQPERCGDASVKKTILVRMPVSSTAYIDLDEIRRMERFGELKLLSFKKHIEIERPSPVSSQHVVGLEFPMPSTNELHAEFPIHFRYQAPSQNDLYRPAFIIAPDIFLFCQGERQPVTRKQEQVEDTAAQDYFQALGLLSTAQQTTSSSRWIRLFTSAPIEATKVLTPVGYLPSGGLVSIVTLVFASVGAAILLWVSIDVVKQDQSLSRSTVSHWKRKDE